MPPADYASFEKPGRLEAFGQAMRACLRQGTKGAAWDMRMYVREFDFRLDEVHMPLAWFHNESHLSTLCNHFDEIAQVLVKPPPEKD